MFSSTTLVITLTALFAVSSCVALSDEQIVRCDSSQRDYFKFMGRNVYTLNTANPTVTFSHSCFKQTTATFSWHSETEARVTLTFEKPASFFCSDTVIVTDLVESHHETKFVRGTTYLAVKADTAEKKQLIEAQGLYVIPTCDSWVHFPEDLAKTLYFFRDELPGKRTQKQKEADMERGWEQLHRTTGFPKVERHVKHKFDIEWMKANIESGDAFCTFGASSVNALISWGTGNVCSHVGTFLWGVGEQTGQLFFVESINSGQAIAPIEKWYYDDFTSIALLKLSKENRAKYDVNKAWEFFNSIAWYPYGWENILFSFYDTREQNVPQVTSIENFMILARMIDKIRKTEGIFDKMIGEAVNIRLGTSGLGFDELVFEANKRGLSISQLLVEPEPQGVLYGKDKRPRYICSAMATAILSAAGVFGYMKVLPNEFTPRDVFELGIWEKDTSIKECKENDPELPYCQIFGKYKFDNIYFNSVKPYAHMNEHCPSSFPDFKRTPGC